MRLLSPGAGGEACGVKGNKFKYFDFHIIVCSVSPLGYLPRGVISCPGKAKQNQVGAWGRMLHPRAQALGRNALFLFPLFAEAGLPSALLAIARSRSACYLEKRPTGLASERLAAV